MSWNAAHILAFLIFHWHGSMPGDLMPRREDICTVCVYAVTESGVSAVPEDVDSEMFHIITPVLFEPLVSLLRMKSPRSHDTFD